jgi:hypothetical protein
VFPPSPPPSPHLLREERFVLSEAVKAHINLVNSSSTKKQWSYAHLEKGFMGGRYEWEDDHTPVLSYNDTKRVLALTACVWGKLLARGLEPQEYDLL